MNDIATARLTLVLCGLIYCLGAAALVAAISRWRTHVVKRQVLGVFLVVLIVAGIFLQLRIYSNMSNIRNPINDDPFFFWWGLGELLIVNVLMFGSAIRSRTHKRL